MAYLVVPDDQLKNVDQLCDCVTLFYDDLLGPMCKHT